MAINKAQTPMWIKVTLIVLIVAFVLSFVTIVANPFSAPEDSQTPAATGTTDAADAQYQPQVNSLTAQLQQNPQDYNTLVTLANTYFDWALAKQQASQTSTSSAGADLPLWISAKDTYARALEIKADESGVRVDHAIAIFYSGDTLTAITLAEGVVKDDPTFAPAPFNLGIFYMNAGQNAKAIAAFEKYLELDPTGTQGGNADFAKQQLESLKNAPTGSQSATGTTAP